MNNAPPYDSSSDWRVTNGDSQKRRGIQRGYRNAEVQRQTAEVDTTGQETILHGRRDLDEKGVGTVRG